MNQAFLPDHTPALGLLFFPEFRKLGFAPFTFVWRELADTRILTILEERSIGHIAALRLI
jgi:hypothetical protein